MIFQAKHFLADYPGQGQYMLGKFKPGWDFLGPLAAHCAVHAVMTALIVVWFKRPDMLWLAAFDFVIHSVMDRIKAGPRYLGRFKALSGLEYQSLMKHPGFTEADRRKSLLGNKFFWWALGLDQGVHHITHYAIIWFLVIPAEIRALILNTWL